MSDALSDAPQIKVTPEEFESADAQYSSFPDVGDWLRLDVVGQVWDDALARSRTVRDAAAPDQYDRAVEQTMRLAAVDTGAIEDLYPTDPSFTYSVAEQSAAWEIEMDKRGAHVRPLFESQLRAYELVLDAATAATPVSEAFIRRIHEEVTGGQETYTVYTAVGPQTHKLPRGEYKNYPNHPWGSEGLRHAYAPVSATGPEMHRLVSGINSKRFANAHPILQASYIHYALAQIHPFADGNGRTSRAAASIYLYRAASIPFLLFADQKPAYLAALRVADRGDYQSFADFVGERATGTVNRFTEILRASQAPPIEQSLTALRNLHVAVRTLSYTELDGRVSAINDVVAQAATEQLAELNRPPTLTSTVTRIRAPEDRSSPFRPAIAAENLATRINLASQAPAEASVAREVYVFVARDRDPRRTYAVTVLNGDSIELSLADVYPDISSDALYRLQTLVRGMIASAAADLYEKAHANLKGRGF